MNFFTSLERSLENIIESALLGKGGQVQPIEIARHLWSEMTANKRVSINDTYVPNYFLVTLSVEDYRFLESVRPTVEREMLEYLHEEARERDFTTLGPLVIHWASGEEIKRGSFSVSSDFLQRNEIPGQLLNKPVPSPKKGDTLINPPAPDVKSSKPEEANQESETAAIGILEVTQGLEAGRRIPVVSTPLLIGRHQDCPVTIGDPTVSRRHAKLYVENKRLYVRDIGSRKGVEVDGRRVDKAVVEEGTRIKLGGTTLIFHRHTEKK